MTRVTLVLGGVMSRLRSESLSLPSFAAGERSRTFASVFATGERDLVFFASVGLPLRAGELVGERELDFDGMLLSHAPEHANAHK